MSEGFSNAILGGASTLIRQAIQSANYVAGSTGWRIAKDGTAEFNNATVRGSVSAGGGTVLLNAGGIHVQGPNLQFDINGNAGFLARKLVDNGSLAQITVGNNGVDGGGIFLTPTSPSAVNNVTWANPAYMFASYSTSGGTDTPYAQLISPGITAKTQSSVFLYGQSNTSASDNSRIDLNGKTTNINSDQFAMNGNANNATANFFVNQFNVAPVGSNPGATFFVNGNFAIQRPRWVVDWGTPSIPNASVTTLTPSSVDVNTGSMGSGSTVTVPTVDVWDIGCILRFATNGTGQRMVRILLNGAELNSFVIATIPGFNTTVGISIKPLLQAGDQIQFTGYQNSGGSLSLVGAGNKAWVMKEIA